MEKTVNIIGAGLAGSEAALRLASLGFYVNLFEMRPEKQTAVHHSANCAELVCSNSLKSTKPDSAAGMLKVELEALQSPLYACALSAKVAAGGALAVDRNRFSESVTSLVLQSPRINMVRCEATDILPNGDVVAVQRDGSAKPAGFPADAVIIASGPLTSDALASAVQDMTGKQNMAFYDAAAPIVMADSLDMGKLFRQSRYEKAGEGDYLNAPMNKGEYERFIGELVGARRVIAKDFETKDLFQACQPIEEVARKGADAPRFGMLKPVGLLDPRTGTRPWAALQLRAEDANGQSYNLVGFQTNLTFPEQKRVFSLIPGLEHVEFARFGVMHRNTFVDAPHALDATLLLNTPRQNLNGPCSPVRIAGQLSGTEGYCEAIRSGAHAAICTAAQLLGAPTPTVPAETAFGALIAYATDPATQDYQPMHVNFGIMAPLERKVKNKGDRYALYAQRGSDALKAYVGKLLSCGLLLETTEIRRGH